MAGAGEVEERIAGADLSGAGVGWEPGHKAWKGSGKRIQLGPAAAARHPRPVPAHRHPLLCPDPSSFFPKGTAYPTLAPHTLAFLKAAQSRMQLNLPLPAAIASSITAMGAAW